MELSEIFKINPMKLFLAEARSQSSRLLMHITGKNMKQAIECMEEFETEQKKNLRQKYSRSNRDIFTRLHRPIDKVFSAKGGSTVINLPTVQQKEFTVYLQSVRKGMSLRKWVQMIALPAYQIDPNGLVFVEMDDKGNPYPTYKGTGDIFYYETNGRNIERVIFYLTEKDALKYALKIRPNYSLDNINPAKATSGSSQKQSQYYRVVDAVSDSIIFWDGDTALELPDLTIPNYFPVCPAFIVSNIYQFDSELMISPDTDVVELANSILTQNSVFEIWKNLHMFPKHWRMQSICPTCQGNGVVSGNECPDCKGTKFQKRSSVRDEIIVPIPDQSDGKINLPTAFDGYTTPSTEAWQLSTDDLDRLYNQMFQTLWGYTPDAKPNVKVSSDDKTATQVLDEGTNKAQRLYSYSEWAESIEKFVIGMCAAVKYQSSYTGCSIHYGDRYVMEGPDVIWLKYSDARIKGGSQAALDDLLRDYYEAKYYGNPISLQVAMKQMRVEPWVHLTVDQVAKLETLAIDKACKIYFSEWVSTITLMDWIMKDEEMLREMLVAYCEPKAAGVDEQKVKEIELNKKPAPATFG